MNTSHYRLGRPFRFCFGAGYFSTSSISKYDYLRIRCITLCIEDTNITIIKVLNIKLPKHCQCIQNQKYSSTKYFLKNCFSNTNMLPKNCNKIRSTMYNIGHVLGFTIFHKEASFSKVMLPRHKASQSPDMIFPSLVWR